MYVSFFEMLPYRYMYLYEQRQIVLHNMINRTMNHYHCHHRISSLTLEAVTFQS
jgi:hypothetical protein